MDNAIVVQEIIHSMESAKGKGGYMALKIDLEKAYDKLEWSFIRGMLKRYNFPDNIIDIIDRKSTRLNSSHSSPSRMPSSA